MKVNFRVLISMLCLLMLSCATAAKSIVYSDTGSDSRVEKQVLKEGSHTIIGTFVKEDGTPASNVRISILEKNMDGKEKNYNMVATMTKNGMELIFDCPGTAVTDEKGILNCSVNPKLFTTKEKRYTLAAQYKEPGTNKMKFLKLRAENLNSILSIESTAGIFNLDELFKRIIVSGY